MSKILTPVSIWKDFDASLAVMPVTIGEKTEDGVSFEYVNFSGRDTGMGRVTVYGVYASSATNPSSESVLILPDGKGDPDENLLKFIVAHGYSAFIMDYAGEREGAERFTRYPENVAYANASACGRHKDFVDDDAFSTCWYEWVAAGVYARKYLVQRTGNENVGLLGIRDGGEIAWKLACAARFSCAVVVSACGWRAYRGFDKFHGKEPEFDEERYRFIAGIDSQAYAPYVNCPVLMLCSTNDPTYDYDRAYDTYSRINPTFVNSSIIAFSVKSDGFIDGNSTRDMFMFLDSYVKNRRVFIPKPAEIFVAVDGDENLVARALFDTRGVIENCGVYYAEDCFDSASRDWISATFKQASGDNESEFFLDVYKDTSTLFALCYVTYSNGFTVWSKIAVKRLSGKFRNSRSKSKILYANQFGNDCFTAADCSDYAVGGIFLDDDGIFPQVITENGLKGIYSKCGLTTYRPKCPQYAPDKDSILQFDVCPEKDMEIEVTLKKGSSNEIYSVKLIALGDVWQSVIQKAKCFKNNEGLPLEDFTECSSLTIRGDGKYAVNNLIWL